MYFCNTKSCCTAKELGGFNEDNLVKLGYINPTERKIKTHLLELKSQGFAIVHCYLTDKQKQSIKLLKSCGFSCTRAVKKTKHPENKLYLLHIKLDTFEG